MHHHRPVKTQFFCLLYWKGLIFTYHYDVGFFPVSHKVASLLEENALVVCKSLTHSANLTLGLVSVTWQPPSLALPSSQPPWQFSFVSLLVSSMDLVFILILIRTIDILCLSFALSGSCFVLHDNYMLVFSLMSRVQVTH